ncbi:MAG: FtsX-like permease family protein [Pseudomonadota bacterium]
MILTLAWRNIWRHRRRSAFGLIAVAVTTAVVVFLPSLQVGSYAGMVNAYLGLLDGHAQIQTPAYLNTPAMRESFAIPQSLRDEIAALPDTVGVSERGIAYVLLASPARSLGAQILGSSPDTEPTVSTIPSELVSGGYLHHEDEIVLGELLARNLKLAPGDEVTLLGVGRDGSLAADRLTVSGVFRTGMPELDRQVAAITLDRFDSTFAMHGYRHAVVLRDDGSANESSLRQWLGKLVAEQGLSLRSWKELQPGLSAAIALDWAAAITLYGVLVAVVVLSLLNTILMSVLERAREFGMLMALGIRPELLSCIVWVETALIALLGAAIGVLAGAGLTLWLSSTGIDFHSVQAVFERYGMSSTIHPQLTPTTLVAGPGVIVATLVLAASLPALRIRRLNVLEAMRKA